MSARNVSSGDILEFWFGKYPDDAEDANRLFETWFKPDPVYDNLISDKFIKIVECAAAGKYDHWARTARGSLALIILLDQMPRNIFRGEARAFATDQRAAAITVKGIEHGWDLELNLIERVFFYIPFEHAEDLILQTRCVSFYQQLDALATPALKEFTGICVSESQRHQDVIRRFGRFPHRNTALGREWSDAERAWVCAHDGWGPKKSVA